MIYPTDPHGRRRGVQQPNRGPARPTLEDYQALAQAYQEQKNALEQARQQLTELSRELGIKNEALQRQSADLKQMEGELMWTKAALNSQEPRPASAPATTAGAASTQAGGDTSDDDPAAWRNRYLRLQAELDNLRKRWEQRFEHDTAEARHQILRDMLPLADHLELAIRHGGALDEGQAREFLRNVEATLRAFLDTLHRYNVHPVEALGQPFDPEIHEAMGQIYAEDAPPNTVVQVIQTGYREGERLLRPARVLVNQAHTNADQE